MVLKVMNYKKTLNKTQPHHTCIPYTTISTTKKSYTVCITKLQVYSSKRHDCMLETQHPLHRSLCTRKIILYGYPKQK